jgi:large subunit ribosomal protein L3
MIACAIRAYVKTEKGLRAFTEAWMKNPPADLRKLTTLPKECNLEQALKKIEENIDRIADIRLLLCSQPRLARIKKKPELMEVKIGGGTIEELFESAKNLLGKEVKVSGVFKEGQLVDVIGITKGKGYAGPVKRWGIKLLSHKARKGRRKPGTLGPWHPAHVLYTVPRGGQLGYHQRTEYNKLILKIGSSGDEVTPKGGFTHYGVVRGDYVMLEGSVPGPPKRLIKIRYPIRGPEEPIITPQITYVGW